MLTQVKGTYVENLCIVGAFGVGNQHIQTYREDQVSQVHRNRAGEILHSFGPGETNFFTYWSSLFTSMILLLHFYTT